jgi:hypothetical protein
MKQYLIFLFSILCIHEGFTQTKHQLDSLRKVIAEEKHDTTIIKAYYEIGALHWYSDRDTALKYFEICKGKGEKYLQKREKSSNSYNLISHSVSECYNNIGLIYFIRGNSEKALSLYQQSLEMATDSAQIFDVYVNIAQVETQLGNLKKGIAIYHKVLAYAEKEDNKMLSGNILMNISYTYNVQGDFRKAISYYYKVLDLVSNDMDEFPHLGILYQSLSNNYINILRSDKELTNLEKDSLKLQIVKYLDLSIEIKKEQNFIENLSYSYMEYATFYIAEKKYLKAKELATTGLFYAKQAKDKRGITVIYVKLSKIEAYLGNYQKQKMYAQKAYQIAKETNEPEIIILATEVMVDIDTLSNNYKLGLNHYIEHITMRDSISNRSNYKELEQQSAKYAYEKKAIIDSLSFTKQIELKNLTIKQEKQQAKSRIFYLMLSAGIGFLSLIIFVIWFRNKKKNEIVKLETQGLKTETKMLRTQMNPHFIFNSLNSIQAFVSNENKLDAQRYLSKFAQLMRLILDNSRYSFIVFENEIKTLELYLELEQLRFNKQFNYEINSHNIDDEFTLIPPMLAQPYIENAILHGVSTIKDGKINIDYQLKGDKIICTIDDNGVGRKKANKKKQVNPNKRESLGIKVTQERIDLFKIEFKSSFEIQIIDKEDKQGNPQGTKVIIEMPWQE